MPITIRKVGLAARLEQEQKSSALTTPKTLREQRGFIEPTNAKEKLRIVFDDSSSMHGQKIKDACDGCIQFMQHCTVNQVAVAVHPMNAKVLTLETDLPFLATLVQELIASGATPLYKTILSALNAPESTTRVIVFSDGCPTDTAELECIELAQEKKVVIDTVYIAESTPKDISEDEAALTLKRLADATGGFFLIFDRTKVNFASAFKYLAPGQRHLLASESFRAALQKGEK